MGGFLSKIGLGDWVVEETPENIQPEVKEEPKAPTRSTMNLSSQQVVPKVEQPVYQPKVDSTNVPSSASSFSAITFVPDPQYMKFIDEFFEKENLKGIDYAEYRAAVREMVTAGMPIGQAFVSAFISFKAMGTTKEYLLETNQHYQNRFHDLTKDFLTEADGIIGEAEGRYNSQKAITEKAIENLNKEEENLKARLIQIETERKTNSETLKALDEDFIKVKSAQDARKTKMEQHVSYVLGFIVEDANGIQNYLK